MSARPGCVFSYDTGATGSAVGPGSEGSAWPGAPNQSAWRWKLAVEAGDFEGGRRARLNVGR
jgi:hypothetical protein